MDREPWRRIGIYGTKLARAAKDPAVPQNLLVCPTIFRSGGGDGGSISDVILYQVFEIVPAINNLNTVHEQSGMQREKYSSA